MSLDAKSFWRVAVCIDRETGFQEQLISGVCRAAEETGDWELLHFPSFAQPYREQFDDFNPQGIIFLYNENLPLMRVGGGAIWVEVNGERVQEAAACVLADDYAAGRKMGEFALSRGFIHVVYVGCKHGYSQLRLQGLRDVLAGTSARLMLLPENFHTTRNPVTKAKLRRLDACIQEGWIPLVVGVNDSLAKGLLHGFRERGWQVPWQVAVAGFDNDELFCRLASPPLSSLDMGFERIGYAAGRELERRRQAADPAPARTRLVVPPGSLIPRRSTDVLAARNPELRLAMERFWRNPASVQQVADLVRGSALSKRTMERHCRKTLGASPATIIRREKVAMAKLLLRTTRLSIKAVAARAGFPSPQTLRVVLKQATGLGPRQYRARGQAPPQS